MALALDDIPLPQNLPLKDARFTLELKDDRKHALQDAQAVQDLLRRVALRGRALDERRRERSDVFRRRGGERVVGDEVEEARRYDADEGGDVLGCFDQCSANWIGEKI
jgi:hypothetical protein